jgi:hypothetical protein
MYFGEIPERSKGTDCKSVGSAFVGSNPTLATIILRQGLRGWVKDSYHRNIRSYAGIAQLVERQPSKL